MIKKRFFIYLYIILIATLTTGIFAGCQSGMGNIHEEVPEYIRVAKNYLLEETPSPEAGAGGGDWIVFSLARSKEGIEKDIKENYLASLDEKIRMDNTDFDAMPTDVARLNIVLWTLKKDPEKYKQGDFCKRLEDIEETKKQGLNGVIYNIIALQYCIENAHDNGKLKAKYKHIQRQYLDYLISEEESDGGFSFEGGSKADMTGMALNALAYFKSEPAVKKVIKRAVGYLSEAQTKKGDMGNCEATAQAIIGLCSVGVDPQKDRAFIKNEISLIDSLKEYYTGEGFSHKKNKKTNNMATEQTLMALVAFENLERGHMLYEPN